MDDWMISTLILFLALLLVYLLVKYIKLKSRVESRARDLYEAWQAREMERQDAVKNIPVCSLQTGCRFLRGGSKPG